MLKVNFSLLDSAILSIVETIYHLIQFWKDVSLPEVYIKQLLL